MTNPTTGAGSPLVVDGLTNSTTYTARVRARNINGYGPYSAPSASFTPTAAGGILTPTILSTGISVATNATSGQSGGNAWGSHQNRGVSTSIGDFVIWISGTTSNAKVTNLKWRQVGQTWAQATTIFSGGVISGVGVEECPHLLWHAATSKLYIVLWPAGSSSTTGQRPFVYSGTPSGGAITMTLDSSAALAQFPEFTAYLGAALMNDGALVMAAPIGANGTAQSIDWWRRTSAGVWQHQIIATSSTQLGTNQGARYAYPHIWPARTGTGAWMMGNRDRTWAEAGMTKPAGDSFGFVFDGIALWYTTDVTASPVVWSARVVDSQAQLSTSERPECLASYAGAFVDAENRFHFVSQKTRSSGAYGNTSASAIAPTQTHFVVTAGTPTVTVSNVVVPFLSASGQPQFCRFMENANGSLFLMHTQSNGSTIRVTAYPNRAVATAGTTWSNLETGIAQYNGYEEFSRRAGSLPSTATPWIGFGSNGGANYNVFQLQLPTA